MCTGCCSCLASLDWIKVINCLLSLALLIANGAYAVWGIFMRQYNRDKRDDLKAYIDRLEQFQNVVSYSDAVLVPVKVIMMIIVRKFCCNDCGVDDSSMDAGFDTSRPRRDYDGGGTRSTNMRRANTVSTFQTA